MNVTYERRKAEGICVFCGKEKADGGVRCRACVEKHKKAWREDVYARRRELKRQNQRYWQRRAAGICTRCGKKEVFPGISMCGPCAEKAREAQQKYKKMRKEKEKA